MLSPRVPGARPRDPFAGRFFGLGRRAPPALRAEALSRRRRALGAAEQRFPEFRVETPGDGAHGDAPSAYGVERFGRGLEVSATFSAWLAGAAALRVSPALGGLSSSHSGFLRHLEPTNPVHTAPSDPSTPRLRDRSAKRTFFSLLGNAASRGPHSTTGRPSRRLGTFPHASSPGSWSTTSFVGVGGKNPTQGLAFRCGPRAALRKPWPK